MELEVIGSVGGDGGRSITSLELEFVGSVRGDGMDKEVDVDVHTYLELYQRKTL